MRRGRKPAKRKSILSLEEARKRIMQQRKKKLKERIVQIKLSKKELKRSKMKPIERLKFDMKEIYFSRFDHKQLKMLYDFMDGVNVEIEKRVNERLERVEKNFLETFSSLDKSLKITLGNEYKTLPISKVSLTKLNLLGESGWKFGFFFGDKLFLYRDIKNK